MLDRSKAEAASPRSRAIVFAVAACLAFAIAGVLAYTGIDYINDGCGCYESIPDDAYGAALLAIAAVFMVGGVALAFNAIRHAGRADR
jgi:TRAP-type C4-dicarboxylate transport system permease small subunit